ncbi:MAG: radical SAM protein [Clostridia bacterium]|nr:radical SAM protein [Clostridia bacterium]
MFKIARVGKHLWEEPVISGDRGSGTIFFSGCTMKCIFCQNYEISHDEKGIEISEEKLVSLMLWLQDEGVHNINLVTPSRYGLSLAHTLEKAKLSGLVIPVVYNTSSYERVEMLRLLDGLIDIYLPDMKYADNLLAKKYSGVPNYFEIASKAICEMRRQQPNDIFDGDFIMKKGVIVRHLILPTHAEDSKKVLDFISSVDNRLYVSLMGQYFPTKQVETLCSLFPELQKRITQAEYDDVTEYFFKVGLKNGFSQELNSAIEDYVPTFDLKELQNLLSIL